MENDVYQNGRQGGIKWFGAYTDMPEVRYFEEFFVYFWITVQ